MNATKQAESEKTQPVFSCFDNREKFIGRKGKERKKRE